MCRLALPVGAAESAGLSAETLGPRRGQSGRRLKLHGMCTGGEGEGRGVGPHPRQSGGGVAGGGVRRSGCGKDLSGAQARKQVPSPPGPSLWPLPGLAGSAKGRGGISLPQKVAEQKGSGAGMMGRH